MAPTTTSRLVSGTTGRSTFSATCRSRRPVPSNRCAPSRVCPGFTRIYKPVARRSSAAGFVSPAKGTRYCTTQRTAGTVTWATGRISPKQNASKSRSSTCSGRTPKRSSR
uniref:(northern house mosquito) hypothetical protein n=1 Tax=Culex pipiens TaxID=7175 RepID=A0A8D8L2M4_CULPI